MKNFTRIMVQDYGWIHLSLGLIGNIGFFVGSVLFLPSFEPLKIIGIWLFVVGSFLMLIGAAGRLLVDLYEKDSSS